jgi:hypothetical protein
VFGMMTKPLIRYLLPLPPPKRKNSTVSLDESASPSPKSITVPFLGANHDSEVETDATDSQRPSSIRDLLTTPTHTVHRLWRRFDDAFMRPVFGGRGFVPFVPTSPTECSGHPSPEWE